MNGDTAEIEFIAHDIYDTALSAMAVGLLERARGVEQAARAEREDAPQQAMDLASAFEKLQDYLSRPHHT